ncbi:hypothetical protein J1614_000066 [Plenodomus biglobosus]|nr:hypothetical protein J1614_000066 [Plenodomus biglobosus]
MAREWAKSQREGWLSTLYGNDSDDGTRKLSQDSIQSRLVEILEKVMSHKYSPKHAANETASLILSQSDVGTPWNNFLGLYLSAAESLQDDESLSALSDYIVALASLPDAVNESSDEKTLDTGGRILHVEPGQAFVFDEGVLWKDLPGFSWNLTESFQGPEKYLSSLSSPASPDTAAKAWRNLNMCIALITQNEDALKILVLAGLGRLGLRTLAMALEHSPSTPLGKNVHLHAPAAAPWLHIAGKTIDSICVKGTERVNAGDLWNSKGGGEVCDSARLQFWKTRLVELGF